jgi:hypothetical protein
LTDCNDLARVVVDTTVQPKAVMFPTDAKLVNRARAAGAAGQKARRNMPSFHQAKAEVP